MENGTTFGAGSRPNGGRPRLVSLSDIEHHLRFHSITNVKNSVKVFSTETPKQPVFSRVSGDLKFEGRFN